MLQAYSSPINSTTRFVRNRINLIRIRTDFGRNVSVSYVVRLNGFGWHDLAVNQQPTDTDLDG
jgi:hypothetical protein